MQEENAQRKRVIIYTDGGCEPNPGPGGFGAVLMYGRYRKEISGGFRLTTNNRMELMAAIAALEALKEPCEVRLYSDSEYLVNAVTKGWIESWVKKRWKKVKNPDLWKRLLQAMAGHRVQFIWVKSHVGIAHNERCDELAGLALRSHNLQVDREYESHRDGETGPAPEP